MSFSYSKRVATLAQPMKATLRQQYASIATATTSASSSASPITTSAGESSQPTHYLITLKRSPIGLPDTSKRTLATLGFLPSSKNLYPKGPKPSANPKLNRSVLHPFSETIAGMILKVKELVEVRNVSEAEGKVEVTRRNGSKGEGRGWEVAGSYRDVGIVNSPSASGAKQDAFSSLFSGSLNSSSPATDDGLSLLERKQKMEVQQKEKEKRDREAFNFEGWTHGGTGQSGASGSVDHPTPPTDTTRLNPTPARPSSSFADPAHATSSWDFGDLLAPPAAVSSTKVSTRSASPAPETPLDPWDLAMLDKVIPASTTTPSPFTNTRKYAGDADEDVLGLLAEPVNKSRQSTSERNSSATMNAGYPKLTERTAVSAPPERTLSPPPHIIGQIVEMGFAPQQARKALAKTDTGMNVEAALELLLAGNTAGGQQTETQGHSRENDEARRLDQDRERRRRRREGPSRSTLNPPATDPDARRDLDEIPFADQADRILAQASAVGMSVFSKANSLWNVGKERAQKIIEERAAAGSAGATRDTRDGKGKGLEGRPRWMMDADLEDACKSDNRVSDNSRVNIRPEPTRFDDSNRDHRFNEHEELSAPIPRHRGGNNLDLLGEKGSRPANTTYQSPARRKPQTGQMSNAAASARGSPIPSAITPKVRSPPQLKRRHYTRATPSQLSTSISSKEAGNSQFKLGSYSEASDEYTRALDALPSDHLLRVPLFTNRAAAYLKQGNHVSAIDDCTKAIELVGLDYHPSKEEPLDDDDAVKDVKLADGLIKALCKRAGAYEMGEKWKQAREDWQAAMSISAASVVFSGPGGVNQRKMVSEGLSRAGKMCDVLERGGNDAAATPVASTSFASKSAATKPSARPAATVKPATPSNPADSVGVAAMRAAASALETEESLRFQLKNSVDTRVSTWSKGKETNIRGLLSSLDMVLDKDEPLWKDIKRPGMAELITDKQLKIGYMKVIARLHPDKLNAANSSVEQRMIANSVFGILNDAWHAHSGV
ncbi:hypothetical protein QFC19_008136 [Naganishia cerealis]|uniref:Uncharacterized protein n=1 Tax=Naganishia cerealis TaxID=610337 RepID=A0ACC2V3Y5_9TREE|nr:hypothetical protein QFC19_008136 [Naganishia cerealis]